ncbi:MAG TPA: SDR family NAD(P)-dependent oxidoreductase [Longimicrobiales bacterium]|nr:SDR family NAD(P)-dependent oxidoreductase [Longimicrobiales bacterium]
MVKDSLVLITGATAGIGEAAARRFAREGARVALWARRAERLEALAQELNAITAVVDVRDRAHISTALDALIASAGVPHVLLNNAGLGAGFAKFHEGNPDDWDVNIDTNFKGAAYVARAVIPHMIDAGRGHIINIGSTAAHMVAPRGHIYSATKHAVRALSEGMNVDLTGTPVKVSLIDPGYVKSEFGIVRFLGDVERAMETYKGFQPLTPDEVADAIFYVANLPDHINIADLVIVPKAQRNMYVIERDAEKD